MASDFVTTLKIGTATVITMTIEMASSTCIGQSKALRLKHTIWIVSRGK